MKIAVIADDLTGANATGVLLSKQGFLTATIVQGVSNPSTSYDAVCIDTNSRYIPHQEATDRVTSAVKSLQKLGAKLYCKRIDSTVRGNIGAEIDAMLNTLGEDTVALVQPSFPASGRITVGGYLLVNGIPVQETDVARDPLSPLTQSFVPHIIAVQSHYPCAHIGMDIILQGREAIAKRLLEIVQSDVRIIVVDAVSQDQIETIATAMASLDKKFISVDPGPLSAAYAQAQLGQLKRGPKILAVVGSVTSQTEKQLNCMIDKWDIKPVYVDPAHLVNSTLAREREIKRAASEGIELVKTTDIILVTTCKPGRPLLDLSTLTQAQNTAKTTLAKRMTDGLATISRRIIEQSHGDIKGYFSSGGEVTASLCAVSGAKGIALSNEVIPLAAFGHFIDGCLDNMPVVTKGGLVGDVSAISTCIRYILAKLSKS